MASTKNQALSNSQEIESHNQPKPTHPIPTPPPNASPEQIRTYLSHLLTTKRRLPEEYVLPVVANWKLGSGQELRSYSPAMYLRIFGHEDGWIIYREAKLAMIYEDVRAKSLVGRYLPCKLSCHPPAYLRRTCPERR